MERRIEVVINPPMPKHQIFPINPACTLAQLVDHAGVAVRSCNLERASPQRERGAEEGEAQSRALQRWMRRIFTRPSVRGGRHAARGALLLE